MKPEHMDDPLRAVQFRLVRFARDQGTPQQTRLDINTMILEKDRRPDVNSSDLEELICYLQNVEVRIPEDIANEIVKLCDKLEGR
jgi:hypothetical protein